MSVRSRYSFLNLSLTLPSELHLGGVVEKYADRLHIYAEIALSRCGIRKREGMLAE
jgi:hypothetical protein